MTVPLRQLNRAACPKAYRLTLTATLIAVRPLCVIETGSGSSQCWSSSSAHASALKRTPSAPADTSAVRRSSIAQTADVVNGQAAGSRAGACGAGGGKVCRLGPAPRPVHTLADIRPASLNIGELMTSPRADGSVNTYFRERNLSRRRSRSRFSLPGRPMRRSRRTSSARCGEEGEHGPLANVVVLGLSLVSRRAAAVLTAKPPRLRWHAARQASRRPPPSAWPGSRE